MNIDKRYIELLASTTPNKKPKWIRRLGIIGFIFIVIGGFLFLRQSAPASSEMVTNAAAHAATMLRLYGMAGLSVGLILVGNSVFYGSKNNKKFHDEFIAYYEKNGRLMPWPIEDVKKEDVKHEPPQIGI